MAYKGLQENYGHIRHLIGMAKSDNTVNVAELTYIVWVSQKLGLSQGELEQLINESEGQTSYTAPFSREDRLKQFHEIINLMFVDGHIDNKEVNHLSVLAVKMGLSSDGTRLLLQSLQGDNNQMIDWDGLEEFFD